MTAEVKNYLKRCTNPAFLLSGLFFIIRAIVHKAARKLFPANKGGDFSPQIKKYQIKILEAGPATVNIVEPVLDRYYNIKLVIGKMQIGNTSDWYHTFSDAEMNVSRDRWGWLLTGAQGESMPFSLDEGLLLMRSWSSQFIHDEVLAKDAYSTGERISNGVLFLILNKATLPPDIKLIFTKLAGQVAKNIEYLPFGLTGNHAFNNARGLYFAGYITGSSDMVAMAIEVARERLPVLITTDGFMREGSSHYHFLFTRWVLEIIWLARQTQDAAALDLFTPFARKLVSRCWFFLMQDKEDSSWNIPLVGDISPDCPPEWLLSLPWSGLALSVYRPSVLPPSPKEEGWTSLFGGIEDGTPIEYPAVMNFSSACGWHRAEAQNWTVFTYAGSRTGALQATHAHLDLCGFALFRNGKPVLADIGRLDYTNSPASQYGRSPNAHNTLMINKMGAVADTAGWMSPSYSKLVSDVAVKKNPNNMVITIVHDGFTRMEKGQFSHKRNITLSSSSVEIEDSVDGKGSCDLTVFFHFPPGIAADRTDENTWRIFPGDLQLVVSDASVSFTTFGKEMDYNAGWFFPAYGKMISSITLQVVQTVTLPVRIKNQILVYSK